MNDYIVSCLISLLIGAVGLLSYILGRKVEKNADFEEKEEAMAEVRRIRGCLDNPDVVDELHDRFRR